jgi:CBS domain-containing protein
MTTDIVAVGVDQTLVDAARLMRDRGVGDVLVTDDGALRGIVTDRDIVIRAVAEGADPQAERVDAVFSGGDLVTCPPDASLEDAERLMKEKAVRRLPIVEGRRPVGIVSLGDLSLEDDVQDTLAEISAAPPNE